MYKNIVSLKNGRAVTFDTDTPFSVEKLDTEWTIVTDLKTKFTLSFKNSEVVTIVSTEVEQEKQTKKSNIKTAITEE